MSWVGTAIVASAAVGGGAGYLGAKATNGKIKGVSAPFEKYSGYRPPKTDYTDASGQQVNILRPVQKQVSDILMQRSAGDGVGYDPARRDALKENFDIEQGRALKDQTADIKNRLSGQGLSRNVAANDALLGKALRHADEEKNLYTNKIDIEDLTRRNEERDVNTQRLQHFNETNFGQENTAANFDKDIFSLESGNERARRGFQVNEAQIYQDPYASALGTGMNYAQGTGNTFSKMNAPQTTQGFQPTSINDTKSGVQRGTYDQDMAEALRTGKYLRNK